MNREQAETLLAKLLFDELDDPTRDELLAYLETDPELREQLGDMRLTVNLLREAVVDQSPTLSDDNRRALLARVATPPSPRRAKRAVLYRMNPLIGVAAVLMIGLGLAALILPSLSRSSEMASRSVSRYTADEAKEYSGVAGRDFKDANANGLANYSRNYTTEPDKPTEAPPGGSRRNMGESYTWQFRGGHAYEQTQSGGPPVATSAEVDAPSAYHDFDDSRGQAGGWAIGRTDTVALDKNSRSSLALPNQPAARETGAITSFGDGHDDPGDQRFLFGGGNPAIATGGTVTAPINGKFSLDAAGVTKSDTPSPVTVEGAEVAEVAGGAVVVYGERAGGAGGGGGAFYGFEVDPKGLADAPPPQQAQAVRWGGDETRGRANEKAVNEWVDAGVRPAEAVVDLGTDFGVAQAARRPTEDGDGDGYQGRITLATGARDGQQAGKPVDLAWKTEKQASLRQRQAEPERLAKYTEELREEVGKLSEAEREVTVARTDKQIAALHDHFAADLRRDSGTLVDGLKEADEARPTDPEDVAAYDRPLNINGQLVKEQPGGPDEKDRGERFRPTGNDDWMGVASGVATDPAHRFDGRDRLGYVGGGALVLDEVEAKRREPKPDASAATSPGLSDMSVLGLTARDAPEFDLVQISRVPVNGSLFADDGKEAAEEADDTAHITSEYNKWAKVATLNITAGDLETANDILSQSGEMLAASRVHMGGEEWNRLFVIQRSLERDASQAQSERRERRREQAVAQSAQTHERLVRQRQADEPAEEQGQLPPASHFKTYQVNPWVLAERDNRSTFALDTDTASYRLVSRYIKGGFLPPRGAVRMEEVVNAFDYNYPKTSAQAFTVHVDAAPAPFVKAGAETVLLKVGVQGRVIGREGRKPAHLVFVVDASGSMDQPDRLPLAQYAMTSLNGNLTAGDNVSLVTYSSGAQVQLENEPLGNLTRINQKINRIQTSGSTNTVDGLKAGYDIATRHFRPDRTNRVILFSDGMANIGETDAQAMLSKVDDNRRQGITLTSAGVGMGGYNDELLEQLANNGDGNYLFLDSAAEARKQFVEKMDANLQTIAKDAKIQVEFNTDRVRRYRLIGYENRDIADRDFRNDAVDAGEVGSGQSATALYELELNGPWRHAADLPPIGTVFVRYRDTRTNQVQEIARPIGNETVRQTPVGQRPRFYLAAAAAQFAELMRGSRYAEGGNLDDVLRVLNEVSAELPLDRDIKELRDLANEARNLRRAP